MNNSNKKPMTRNEMISKIASITNQDKKVVKDIMTAYENVMMFDLTNNLETRFGLIGKIKIKKNKERTGLNPSTGQKVIIPAKVAPKFTFSKGLKEHIAKNVKI